MEIMKLQGEPIIQYVGLKSLSDEEQEMTKILAIKSIFANFKDEYDVFEWWLSDQPIDKWVAMRDQQLKLF